MPTALAPARISFDEFESSPTPEFAFQELRNGEVFELAPPKHKHLRGQERIRARLAGAAAGCGVVVVEMGFKIGYSDYRIADVAFVYQDRWDATDPEGYFLGAPDLVVEILSPSNSCAEMRDKAELCLANGASEFWVVDLDSRSVSVTSPDGVECTYRDHQSIPLPFGGSLPVHSLFS